MLTSRAIGFLIGPSADEAVETAASVLRGADGPAAFVICVDARGRVLGAECFRWVAGAELPVESMTRFTARTGASSVLFVSRDEMVDGVVSDERPSAHRLRLELDAIGVQLCRYSVVSDGGGITRWPSRPS